MRRFAVLRCGASVTGAADGSSAAGGSAATEAVAPPPSAGAVFRKTYRTLRGVGESSALLRHAYVSLPPEQLGRTAAELLRLHRALMGVEGRLAATPRYRLLSQASLRAQRQRLSARLAMQRYKIHGRKLFVDGFVLLSLLTFLFFSYQVYRAWWIHTRRQEKFEALVAAPIQTAMQNLELEARRKKGIADTDGDKIY